MNDKVQVGIQAGLAVLGQMFPQVKIATDFAATEVAKTGAHDIPVEAVDAASAAFATVENIKGVDIGNEVNFRAGCALVEQGFKMIQASLKDHTDGTPTPQPQV